MNNCTFTNRTWLLSLLEFFKAYMHVREKQRNQRLPYMFIQMSKRHF